MYLLLVLAITVLVAVVAISVTGFLMIRAVFNKFWEDYR